MSQMSQGFDWGNEEEQSQGRAYGPVPAGSIVRMMLELEDPMYPAQGDHNLSQTKGGLLMLPCKFTVVGGQYDGVYWFDQMALPSGMQRVQLTEGQAKACQIAGSKLRAIIEASRGIDPKDNSPQACQRRRTKGWSEFHGVQFPAKLGINNKPREKNGKQYWDNTIARVIPCTDKEYAEIRQGREIITDGPIVGDPSKIKARNGGNGSGYNGGDPFGGYAAPANQDPFGGGPDYPEQRTDTDQVPF